MGIRTVYQSPVKIGRMLNLVKDGLGLRVPGVYCIPCTCAGKGVQHQRYLRLGQLDKSALAERASKFIHQILFSPMEVLFCSDGYWECVICKTLEINLHSRTVNRDTGLQLNPAEVCF